MSEKQINIGVGADVSQFTAAMGLLQESVKKLPENIKPGIDKVGLAIRTLEKDFRNLAATEGIQSEATKDAYDQLMKLKQAQQQLNAVTQGAAAPLQAATQGAAQMGRSMYTLNNSVMQLSREMPNFAMNMTTGFMAISNNLPSLVDGIKQFRTEQSAIVAGGGQATSLFAALTSSTMLFNIGIGAAITALTVFGPKLIEWISNLGSVSDALYIAAQKQRELNQAVQDSAKYWDSIRIDGLKDRFKELAEAEKEHNKTRQEGLDKLTKIELAGQKNSLAWRMVWSGLSKEFENYRSTLTEINKKWDKIDLENAKKQQERLDALRMLKAPFSPPSQPTRDELNSVIPDGLKQPSDEENLGEKIAAWQKIFSAIKAVNNELGNYRRNQQLANEVSKEATVALNQLVIAGFTSLGDAMGRAIAGTADFGEALAKNLLTSISSILVRFGELAIAAGVAALGIKVALTTLNPVLAIVGGIALVAIGSALSGFGSKAMSSLSSGGGGSYGGYSGGGRTSFTPSTVTVFIDGRVRGNDLVLTQYNQGLRNGRVR